MAVSGGPDSLALLVLANAALPGRIEVATVDHGLRPESADEARFVVDTCRSLGIPVAVLTVDVQPGNVQDQARQARYDALAKWAHGRLAAVATAHHADDQAETLLMRLNRGSGLSGLVGVRERSQLYPAEALLLRPLLRWRKSELESMVSHAGIEPVRDPSNTDPRFDRARLRPRLAQADWLSIEGLARSAALLSEAEDEIVRICTLEFLREVDTQERETRYTPKGGVYIRKRIVQMIYADRGREVTLAQVADLIASLDSGKAANLAGTIARPGKGVWTFTPEPPRRSG